MGMKEGKVWGETSALLVNDRVEVHKIFVHAGAKCSEHRHMTRFNMFYVLDGLLKIRVWKEATRTLDETVLQAGQSTTVAPGDWHQFEALDMTRALEIYYPAEFTSRDIERRTQGSSD